MLIAVLVLGTGALTALAVELVPSSVTGSVLHTYGPPQDNHVIALGATVSTESDEFAVDATVTFNEVDGRAPSCVVAVDAGNDTRCNIPDIAAGSYSYTVTYSGNTVVAESVSEPFGLSVAPDSVDATGVGVNYSTFYPKKDGYRDTLTIRGNRHEPISVSIKIYNSNGKRVKSVTKSRGSGPYSYAWTGKDSSGAILPAGKYRIAQKLTDAAGTSKTFTSHANLNRKILVTRTVYVTKKGTAATAGDSTGSGSIKGSTSGGYIRLHGAGYGNWAGAGYQFKLPSATFYKSISFQVYVQAAWSVPPNELAMQNFQACPSTSGAWNLGCFDRVSSFGSQSTARHWDSTKGSITKNRKGQIVRGLVSVNFGNVYVYKARVKVVYQVLQ